MHNPELQSLARINWQFFCTLTFSRENLSEGRRLSIFFAVMRLQAKNSGVHFKNLVWCLRRERGEALGRIHYHAVIAGFPKSFVNKPSCFATEKIWKSLGGGHAKVTEYVSSLDGLDYILKGLAQESQPGSLATRYAGDYHELTKFGESCEVTLSESCVRVLDGRQSYRTNAPSTVRKGQCGNLSSPASMLRA